MGYLYLNFYDNLNQGSKSWDDFYTISLTEQYDVLKRKLGRFATMVLENGMNVKNLSDMIGHISAETTLNIYSHITDTTRVQASVKIGRKIGGADASMPETKDGGAKDNTNEPR